MKLKIESVYENSLQYLKIVPANECIPEWYKDMPVKLENTDYQLINEIDGSTSRNITIKGCSPFLDGLTTGYMAITTNEIQISKPMDVVLFSWRAPEKLISTHSHSQAPLLPEIKRSKDVFKWEMHDRLVTPKGYSTLFTHPFNRHDLPFRTFTGIVETDSYVLPTLFPFQISADVKEPFILPIGTPVAQIFPFKRDNWEREIIPYDEHRRKIAYAQFLSRIVRSYKKQWWVKKTYI
jgi:hypothetical protein